MLKRESALFEAKCKLSGVVGLTEWELHRQVTGWSLVSLRDLLTANICGFFLLGYSISPSGVLGKGKVAGGGLTIQ